jgi:AraC-like DNA-binding protein
MKNSYIEGEWINALMRTFSNLGLDTRLIIKDIAGFENEQLIPGYRLEVSSARQMWHQADKMAQDPLLGVKIGSSQDYRAVGVLAPVVWHSPDTRTALNNIVTFQTLISESGCFHVDEILVAEEGVIQCEYVAVPNIVPANAHQILAVVIGTVGIIQAISNNRIKVKRLYVPLNLDAMLISKALGCEVESRAGNLAIYFSSDQFDEPLLGCDNHLYQINRVYAEELLRAKRAGLALIDSVKHLIEGNGFSRVSSEQVELSLGMHKRTLQRNLSEQGTSFRQVKEAVLKEQAASLLLKDKIEIESVAAYLGYSEASAFHRAFKAWFGITPKQFCSVRQY